MINSTNTVNIDGAAFKEIDFKKAFESENQDFFSRWVARPLALLATTINVAPENAEGDIQTLS